MTETIRKKSIVELRALPPTPRNLALSGQNGCFGSTTIEALERRVGLRRNATRAPTQAPEWRGRFRPPRKTRQGTAEQEVALPTKRKDLNLEIIGSNLSEAIEELHGLRDRASKGELTEADLQVGLAHAYHHLNFAWHIRHVSTAQYAKLTKAQFDRWGRYPSDLDN
jgi:hypothetical protein